MRVVQATLIAVLLTACGGLESGADDASADLSGSCGGLKPAHCFCRIVGGSQMTTGSPDSIIDPHIEGQPLFTFTVPGKCYNQAVDLANAHFDNGCWKDCRDSFGIEGATRDPEVTRLLQQAGKDLRALGACGGWHSAPLEFAAGTNKWRSAAAMGIGVSTGGRVVIENGQKVCK